MTIVFFLNWFHRAYANLHRIGIANLSYPAPRAAWAFFIPILNLFQPYRIAEEIRKETEFKLRLQIPNFVGAASSNLIGFWWFFWLTSNFVNQISTRMYRRASFAEDLLAAEKVSMVGTFLTLVAALLALNMIKKMSQDETQLRDHIRLANELETFGEAPTEDEEEADEF